MANEKTPSNLLENLYKQYAKDKYNILFPTETLMSISPLQTVSYELLHIDPKPMPDGQDVYSVGKEEVNGKKQDKLAFGKTALERIANAAGVQINYNASHFEPTGNPRSVRYVIVGGLRLPNGDVIPSSKSKTIDLDVVVEKTRKKYTEMLLAGMLQKWEAVEGKEKKQPRTLKNDEEGRRYVEGKVKDEEIKIMENKEALAETKAHERLVRSLLGLKSWYTAEELAKPFVIVKVSTNIAFLLADPKTRSMASQMALQSQFMMFGLPQAQSPKQITQNVPFEIIDSPEEIQEDKTPIQADQIISAASQTKSVGDPMLDTPLQDVIDAFKLARPEERLTSLKQWIERKGYTPKAGLPKPEDMNVNEQVAYLTHLHGLKDKERV